MFVIFANFRYMISVVSLNSNPYTEAVNLQSINSSPKARRSPQKTLPSFVGCCSVDKSLCALLVNSCQPAAAAFVDCLPPREGDTNYLRLRRRLLRQQINKFDKQYKRLPALTLFLPLLLLVFCVGMCLVTRDLVASIIVVVFFFFCLCAFNASFSLASIKFSYI